MRKIALLFMSFIALVGCDPIADEIQAAKKSTLPELNGKYVYEDYRVWGDNSEYEYSASKKWSFDNSRRALYSYLIWSYTESGWENQDKYYSSIDFEWKTEDGKFYVRSWDHRNDGDTEWQEVSFEFIDSNSFILDGYLYKKE